MSFSIIIPIFNRIGPLKKCLPSLESQLKEGDEVLLIDDGSDELVHRELQELYSHRDAFQIVPLGSNYGQGKARNKGAFMAKNEWLLFLDSDIELGVDHLAILRQYLSQENAPDAVTGRIALYHPYHDFFSRYKNAYMNFVFGRFPREVNFLYGGICCIKAEAFVPWPELHLYGEDTELGLQLTKNGNTIHLLHELEVIHHKSYNGFSLLINDFLIPFGFARSFWLFKGWRAFLPTSMNTQERVRDFSHVKPIQVFSLVVSFFIFFFLLMGNYHFLFLGIPLFLMVNRKFFGFLLREEGSPFLLKAIFWTLLDQIVMFIGVGCGLFYHGLIIIKEREKEWEVSPK